MFCCTNVTYVTLTHLKKCKSWHSLVNSSIIKFHITTSVKYKMSLGSGIKTKLLESKQTYKSKK